MSIDLETERLLLKCIGRDDAEFFYKQFSNDEVNQYLYDTEPCNSVEQAQPSYWRKGYMGEAMEFRFWQVYDIKTNLRRKNRHETGN
ncbi:MAG: hypothetical protein GX918_02790 [Clostridiales bacterium]|jgi:RimJ/RimL family protein N-acetyltransferase|nr:hypothetical protein [Clostridiales bacterium]NLZ90829.1 hypothetical protein [Clostridiales bacterium]